MGQTLELIIKARDEASAAFDRLKTKTQLSAVDMAAVTAGITAGMAGLALEIDAVQVAYEKLVLPAQEYILAVDELATKGQISREEAAKWTTLAGLLDIPIATIEMAFRKMNSDGISPTIENLSILAEQFLAIEGPEARAQFAVEQFGAKTGQDMLKALELGAAGLDRLTSSVGLVVKPTDEATEAAKNLALAQAALEASILQMTVTTGTALMPWAMQVITTLDILLHPLDFLRTKIEDVIGAFRTLFEIGSRNLPGPPKTSAKPVDKNIPKALGGEVGTGGDAYMVGEHGAERFTPSVPGTISPTRDQLASSIDRMVKTLPTILIDAIERAK